MALTNLVLGTSEISKAYPVAQEEEGQHLSQAKGIDYSKLYRCATNSMPLLDKNLKEQGFSKSEIKFTRQAWRPNTKKVYSNYLRQWIQYCEFFGYDPCNPETSHVTRFLIMLAKQGCAYSTVNIARCSLSAVIHKGDYNTIGSNRYVGMVVAATGNSNPPQPKYSTTWNVKDVFRIFKRWGRNTLLSLQKLSWKLVVLLLLCTAQRGQTIWLLKLSGMSYVEGGVSFRMQDLLKHNKPGDPLSVIRLAKFEDDTRLCPVKCLKAYVKKTKELRGSIDQLLISTVKPYRAIGRNTVSNWVKRMLEKAGINTKKFKAHSTRSAATSMVTKKGIDVNALLKVASWKSEQTFGQFYNKPIEDESVVMVNTLLRE